MTGGAYRAISWQRWSRFCRPGRGTRWAVTTRACRTVRQWMRSFSCYAPGVIGMPCARLVSARHPRRIGAFRNGSGRAYSPRSGARDCWPMTRCKALTGDGWRWTERWARHHWVGKKTGRNPTDRGKRGVKRSLLTDGRGVPLGAVIDEANRNDHKLMRQTLEAIPVRRPKPTRQQPRQVAVATTPGESFSPNPYDLMVVPADSPAIAGDAVIGAVPPDHLRQMGVPL